MKLMNTEQEIRDARRMQNSREELIERLARVLPEDGAREVLPGFILARLSQPSEARSVYQPAFCFVVQGGKQVLLNEEVYRYDSGHYLLFTVDLPLTFKVEKASPERPYYGFRLNLEPSLVASVVMEFEAEIGNKKTDRTTKAISVSPVDADLLDAAVRLIRTLDDSGSQKMLAPLIKREIVYRLLTGGQGARLAHLLAASGDTRLISKAIGHLRDHFDEPLRIEAVARRFGMSVSGFHHQFKAVTAMSPLQFQKQLRLQEARQLMMSEDLDAASAGFRVGYDNPAHFSREYKKMFGAPPLRDTARLRSNL